MMQFIPWAIIKRLTESESNEESRRILGLACSPIKSQQIQLFCATWDIHQYCASCREQGRASDPKYVTSLGECTCIIHLTQEQKINKTTAAVVISRLRRSVDGELNEIYGLCSKMTPLTLKKGSKVSNWN